MSEVRPFVDARRLWRHVSEYFFGLGIIALSCLIASFLPPGFVLADLVMIFLLGVAFASTRIRLAAAIFTAVFGVLTFEYFFLPPLHTFAVVDPKHLVTFTVMLFVAVTISGLTERIRHQKEAAQQRERHTGALYSVSRELAEGRQVGEFAAIAARHIHEVFDCRVVVLLEGAEHELSHAYASEFSFELDDSERDAARLAMERARPTGGGTAFARSKGVYLPLSS